MIKSLDECLTFDLQLFQETSLDRAKAALSEEKEGEDVGSVMDRLASLPSDLMLKLTALSILPSHTLRIQGLLLVVLDLTFQFT